MINYFYKSLEDNKLILNNGIKIFGMNILKMQKENRIINIFLLL